MYDRIFEPSAFADKTIKGAIIFDMLEIYFFVVATN
jgi:hypothetical protein